MRFETMSINDDIFENLRKDFDITLQRLFEKIIQADEDEGTLTVKIKVSLMRDQKSIEGANQAYIFHCPHFETSVTSSVAQKETTKSSIDMHGYELIKDNAAGYILKNVNDQITLADYE